MAVIQTILEYSSCAVQDGVIHGVKIAGLKSNNGHTYPLDVLAAAVKLYEEAPVYVLHGTARERQSESRKFHAHLGNLRNVHMRDTGLFGDLHVKQSHPIAGMILESDGRKFGLSHNVRALMTDDRKTVAEIISVNSVDLVDNPATTLNLFEEDEDMTLEEYQELAAERDKRLDALAAKIDTLCESLAKPPEEPAKPAKKGRIAVLQESVEADPDAPAPMGNSHQELLDACRGFQTI